MNYVYIRIAKWSGTTSNGVPCKNQTEIDQYINSNSLLTIVSLAYYDFDDYEDPIKYYIDTKMYFTLVSGFTKNS